MRIPEIRDNPDREVKMFRHIALYLSVSMSFTLNSATSLSMRRNTESETLDRCVLAAPVFTAFGPAVFRRAESDGVPAMVVSLGEALAVLPLSAVQRAFDIADASPDGRMLAVIAESLDYVAGLRLGDRLPPEVLTGRPGRAPAPRHRQAACERMRRAGAVHCTLALVEELACLEALRETLFRPALRLPGRLRALAGVSRGDAERRATLVQVRRLAETAARRLATEFATATQAGLTVSGPDDGELAALRAARDRLGRLDRAFLPVLAEWDAAAAAPDGNPWPRVIRTYRFLAPRFMAAAEWERATPLACNDAAPAPTAAMAW
jgi:hypothetical protein